MDASLRDTVCGWFNLSNEYIDYERVNVLQAAAIMEADLASGYQDSAGARVWLAWHQLNLSGIILCTDKL